MTTLFLHRIVVDMQTAHYTFCMSLFSICQYVQISLDVRLRRKRVLLGNDSIYLGDFIEFHLSYDTVHN